MKTYFLFLILNICNFATARPAFRENYPWMAFISTYLRNSVNVHGKSIELTCDGAVISPSRIVTAADCWSYVDVSQGVIYKGSLASVMLGASHTDTITTVETRKVVVHPKWVPNFIIFPLIARHDPYLYNIAVMVLDETIQFTAFINAISLPEYWDELNEDFVGHGALAVSTTDFRSQLQAFDTTVLPNEQCAIATIRNLTENYMCARIGALCNVDHGGPLVYKRSNSEDVLIGILSFTLRSCKETGSVYFLRITKFLEFIVKNMEPRDDPPLEVLPLAPQQQLRGEPPLEVLPLAPQQQPRYIRTFVLNDYSINTDY